MPPCGKLFGTLFGMDYHVAMIISAIVIVGYTATGGFTAASTTDLVQSIVMSIALVVVLVFGVSKAGRRGRRGGECAEHERLSVHDGYL